VLEGWERTGEELDVSHRLLSSNYATSTRHEECRCRLRVLAEHVEHLLVPVCRSLEKQLCQHHARAQGVHPYIDAHSVALCRDTAHEMSNACLGGTISSIVGSRQAISTGTIHVEDVAPADLLGR
jgi:hypothetical protein